MGGKIMAVHTAERLVNENQVDIMPSLRGLVGRAASCAPAETVVFSHLAKLQKGTQPKPAPLLAPFIANNLLDHVGQVRNTVDSLGTTDMHIGKRRVLFDGQEADLTFITATGEDECGEADNMSGGVWIRDQAFIAKSLLEEGALANNKESLSQGQQLLSSLLHCMSTPSQLARFDNVIRDKDAVKPQDHPSIKYDLRPGGNGVPVLELATDWGHNQDAWQILAATALDACDKGIVSKKEIAKYAEFFRRIPAFLHEVDYLEKESKGSWEEVNAKGRLSTIAWEWTTLVGLQNHADLFGFDGETRSLMKDMIRDGAEAIIDRFPNESAYFHEKGDPAYREEDAALIYLGLAQVPEQLSRLPDLDLPPVDFSANPKIKAQMDQGLTPEDAMYRVMFDTLDRLKDPVTGGYARYAGDSYQASNFWLPTVWDSLTGNDGLWVDKQYRDPEGIIHFAGRGILVDEVNRAILGDDKSIPIARWMHPNTQTASVAFRRVWQTKDPEMKQWYKEHGARDLKDALRMITNEDSYTIRPCNGQLEVTQLPSGVAPECMVTNSLPDGSTVIHPGPWGPLLWAASGIRSALAWAEGVN